MYLDLIPLVITALYGVSTLSSMLIWNYITGWQHWLALVFLIFTSMAFTKRHQLGILCLGLTLILGVIGILSFDLGNIRASVYWTPFDIKIPLFIGNPVMFVLLILHLILSGRYYVGILSKKYWYILIKEKANTTDHFS